MPWTNISLLSKAIELIDKNAQIIALEKTLSVVHANATALAIRLSGRAININAFVDDLNATHIKAPVEIFYVVILIRNLSNWRQK